MWLRNLKPSKGVSPITELNLGLLVCCAAKLVYWPWVVVEESTAFIAGCQARRMGSSSSKDLNSMMDFRGKNWKVLDQLTDLLGWAGNEVTEWCYQNLTLPVRPAWGLHACAGSVCSLHPPVGLGRGLSFYRAAQRHALYYRLYPFRRN